MIHIYHGRVSWCHFLIIACSKMIRSTLTYDDCGHFVEKGACALCQK